MADRGSELYELEDGSQFWWKRCEMPSCENMVCHGLSPIFCWPHAMSGGAPVTKRKDRVRVSHRQLGNVFDEIRFLNQGSE